MPLRVLITGATSGLNREIARQLASGRARLALAGPGPEALEEAGAEMRKLGSNVLVLPGSMADRAAVREHYSLLKERWSGLDWAILDAGVPERRPSSEFSADEYHSIFTMGVGGVVNWIEAVLPDMRAARRGTIVGMASLAGFRGLPGHGPLGASMAALVNLMETLRVDLGGSGIKVVTVCPGLADVGGDAARAKTRIPVGPAARRILRGVKKGRPMVAFPWPLAFYMRYILPNAPYRLYDRAARALA